MKQAGWRLLVKRGIDVTIASLGIVSLSPVMLVAASAVHVSMGRPILFRQLRPGQKGRTIELLKFRTMSDLTDSSGSLLPDAERLTPTGRFLRELSIDELPQLWNVLRGDISLVGPRPLLHRYLPRYSKEQARRHDVLPGITGWAQINGRNAIDWEEKLKLDIWYVDHWNLSLDVLIIMRTVARVILRSGISSEGHATMPEFEGNKRNTSFGDTLH